MIFYIAIVVCLILAGCAKAIMDIIRSSFTASVFAKYADNKWVNPNLSWENKWFSTNKLVRLLFSTVLVWTTDCWHFCQHIYLMLLFGSMVLLGYVFLWWLPLAMYAFFTFTFQIFYWSFGNKK